MLFDVPTVSAWIEQHHWYDEMVSKHDIQGQTPLMIKTNIENAKAFQ